MIVLKDCECLSMDSCGIFTVDAYCFYIQAYKSVSISNYRADLKPYYGGGGIYAALSYNAASININSGKINVERDQQAINIEGIRVYASGVSGGCNIRDATISIKGNSDNGGNGYYGIKVYSDGAKLNDNRIEFVDGETSEISGGTGIYLSSGSSNCNGINNIITNADTDIDDQGTNNTINYIDGGEW